MCIHAVGHKRLRKALLGLPLDGVNVFAFPLLSADGCSISNTWAINVKDANETESFKMSVVNVMKEGEKRHDGAV